MFEEFPPEEYQRRLERVRKLMRKENIDALLLTTEVNLRYLAGLVNCFWIATMRDDLQAGIIPVDEEAGCTLLLPDHLCYGSAQSSWITDRRAWPQFSAGKLPGPVEVIAQCLAEKSLDRARIGIERGADSRLGMSPAYFEHLLSTLPHCEFVDCDGLLLEARKIKSPLEIKYIRRASEITCEGMKAGLEMIREGISEIEIGKSIVQRWGEVSDDFSSSRPWFLFIYSSPYRSQWFDCGPTDYRLQKGNYVVLDIGFCYRGYWADMYRTACIGNPGKTLKTFYEASQEGNFAGIGRIAPGIPAKEIALAVVKRWKKMGFETEVYEMLEENDYDFVGHGLGLTIHEPPVLHTQQNQTLEPGMYLALEAMLPDRMPFKKAKVAVGIEDDILITDTGFEVLTESVPQELFIK